MEEITRAANDLVTVLTKVCISKKSEDLSKTFSSNNKKPILSELYILRAGLSMCSVINDESQTEQKEYDIAYTESKKKNTDNILYNFPKVTPRHKESKLLDKYNFRFNWKKAEDIKSQFITCLSNLNYDDCVKLLQEIIEIKKNHIRLLESHVKWYNRGGLTPLIDGEKEVLDRLENLSYRKITTGLQEMKIDLNRIKSKHADKTEDFKNMLMATLIFVEPYTEVLDPRDWQYLDLIIYYFETNRATSLKEALQLVDMERRNQQLINAIATATRAICNSITAGFAAIQNSIAQGFASMQNTLQSGLDELNQTARAQLTATNLSNALQVKANTTSEQLANDMRHIRNKYYI